VPTSLLVPQIVDSVDIPVIAAGGFLRRQRIDRRDGLRRRRNCDGDAVLLTRESPVPMSMKQRYLRTQNHRKPFVTSSIDGHPHRVIRTELIADLERHGLARELAGCGAQCTSVSTPFGPSLALDLAAELDFETSARLQPAPTGDGRERTDAV